MRLADGTLWPIPINLDVSQDFAGKLSAGDRVALRHPEGMVLAVLTVSDIWEADRAGEAQAVPHQLDGGLVELEPAEQRLVEVPDLDLAEAIIPLVTE